MSDQSTREEKGLQRAVSAPTPSQTSAPNPAKRRKLEPTKAAALSTLPPPKRPKLDTEVNCFKSKRLLRIKNTEQKVRIQQQTLAAQRLREEKSTLQRLYVNKLHAVGVINRHWDQLESTLSTIITSTRTATHTSVVPRPTPTEPSTPNVFAQILKAAPWDKPDPDNDSTDDQGPRSVAVEWSPECDQALLERCAFTQRLLKTLVDASEAARAERRAVWDKLASLDAAVLTPILSGELTQLRAENERLTKALSEQHSVLMETQHSASQSREKLAHLHDQYNWLEHQNYQIVCKYNSLLRASEYRSGGAPRVTPKAVKAPIDTPMKIPTQDEEAIGEIAESRLVELNKLRQTSLNQANQLTQLQREKAELLLRIDNFSTQCHGQDMQVVQLTRERELLECSQEQQKERFNEQVADFEKFNAERINGLQNKLKLGMDDNVKLRHELRQSQLSLDKALANSSDKLVGTLEEITAKQRMQIGKLRSENKRLKAEVGDRQTKKTVQELHYTLKVAKGEIKQLKDTLKGENMFKAAKYKSEINRLFHLSKKLEKELTELKKTATAKRVDELTNTVDVLMKEVNNSAEQIQDLQQKQEERIEKLVKDMKELSDDKTKLVSKSVLWNHKIKRLTEEKEEMGRSIDCQSDIQAKQSQCIAQMQENIRMQKRSTDSVTDAYNRAHQAASEFRQTAQNASTTIGLMRKEMAKKNEIVADMEKKLSGKAKEQSELEKLLQTTKEEKLSQGKRLERMKQKQRSYRSNEVLEKQIDLLDEKIKCSTCSKRNKSVIIAKGTPERQCYHMFCKECVDDQIRNRNRRCAKCRLMFGAKDIRSITFA